MKEAMFYKRLKDKVVNCILCPHFCVIKPGNRGKCHVRENHGGKLISLVYGRPCAIAVDPIEKKPLYHFFPGSLVLSFGTAGCNFFCLNCQNAWMSQSVPEKLQQRVYGPEDLVRMAHDRGCKGIAYTYNEPTVFYEYVHDTAKMAHKAGLKNIFVSNGFINPGPLKKLMPFMDAFSMDLKGIDDGFYRKICGGRVKPVLECLKIIKENNKHLEVINLLIPGYNDSSAKIKKLCLWIKGNLGADIPLHFSRYFPCYRLKVKATPVSSVLNAKEIALKVGLKNVHMGNV